MEMEERIIRSDRPSGMRLTAPKEPVAWQVIYTLGQTSRLREFDSEQARDAALTDALNVGLKAEKRDVLGWRIMVPKVTKPQPTYRIVVNDIEVDIDYTDKAEAEDRACQVRLAGLNAVVKTKQPVRDLVVEPQPEPQPTSPEPSEKPQAPHLSELLSGYQALRSLPADYYGPVVIPSRQLKIRK